MSKPTFMQTAAAHRADSIVRRPSAAFQPAAGPTGRMEGVSKLPGASTIAVDRIIADPDQPRQDFDAETLRQLADSLATHGQLQPVRVRWSEGAGVYVIVSGERRWRAAQMVGLAGLHCVVEQTESTPDDLLERQLVENCLREGLKPIEQARAYQALMQRRGMSARELAARLNVEHSGVSGALKLLDLPEAAQADIDAGRLAPSSARKIAISDLDDEAKAELAARAVEGGMSRAEVVEAVRRSAPKARKPSAGKGRGAGPAKLPTSRTFRLPGNFKIVIEGRRGIDRATIAGLLRDALAVVEAEAGAEAA